MIASKMTAIDWHVLCDCVICDSPVKLTTQKHYYTYYRLTTDWLQIDYRLTTGWLKVDKGYYVFIEI